MGVPERNISRFDEGLELLSPSAPLLVDDLGVLNLKPQSPVLYRVSANSFDLVTIDGEQVLVPQLGMDFIEPGVNGVGPYKATDIEAVLRAATPVMRRRTAEGWRYLSPVATIPTVFLPDGVAAGGYLRVRPTVTPSGLEGKYWYDAWTTFELGADGVTATSHRDIMNRYLHAANIVGRRHPGDTFDIAPTQTAIARIKGPTANAIKSWERANNIPTDVRNERLEQHRANLAALENAMAPFRAKSAPKPDGKEARLDEAKADPAPKPPRKPKESVATQAAP